MRDKPRPRTEAIPLPWHEREIVIRVSFSKLAYATFFVSLGVTLGKLI